MIPDSLKCLVLNSNGKPVKLIDWQRAIVLVYEHKVIQLDFYSKYKLRDGHGRVYSIPAVIMLKKYVREAYRYPKLTRKNIYIRDNYRCQYCSDSSSKLSLDHVIPKSKKGKTSWDNLVTCCIPCNRRKADRTCLEARMYPNTLPVRPTFTVSYLGIQKENSVEEWKNYL